MTLKTPIFAATLALFLISRSDAQDNTAASRLLDRIIKQEQEFVRSLADRTPLIETYIQEIAAPGEEAVRPGRDHYFLGRAGFSQGISYTALSSRSDTQKGSRLLFFRNRSVMFSPAGFAQMIFAGADGLSREGNSFDYVRREFLGDIRCLLFDVAPLEKDTTGRFIGRIWVEDKEFRIVRLNGTFTGRDKDRLYFHFDSWRVNVAPGRWIPAFVYVEESSPAAKGQRSPLFKAQTRLWGYDVIKSNRLDELTNILVEADSKVQDKSDAGDLSPLESQRLWERQAEENIIDRLEKGGLLAPKGEVEEVLNGVVNNLIVTNNLNIEAQCRVLLTTPLETFSVGHTIVISRGLLDVLPDEASLAMALADELAHIALGHRTNTQFAFNNQVMLSDETLMERFRFSRTPEEIASASSKAVAMLAASPYKDKLGNAGLFLKALSSRAPQFPNLIRPNLGNRLADGSSETRMADLISRAPTLENDKLEQIAALPLGSRVRVNPANNHTVLVKNKPIALLSAREKMLFEIAPFMIHLKRAEAEKSGGEDTAARDSPVH